MEEQNLQREIGRARHDRAQAVENEKEKGDRELVEISQQASNQAEAARKFNSERVHALNENQQKNYETIAKKTSDELKRIETSAQQAIEAHKFGALERIRSVTERGEDPFYHLKSLDPVLNENENFYTVQVKLPEHEAQNLFVSAQGPYLKLSLARR